MSPLAPIPHLMAQINELETRLIQAKRGMGALPASRVSILRDLKTYNKE